MKTNRTMTVLVILAGLLLGQDARAFYNPQTGRWLSRDPIEEPGLVVTHDFVAAHRRDESGLLTAWAEGMEWSPLPEVELAPAARAVECRLEYSFVGNEPQRSVDVLGLFGDGYNGEARPGQFRGHSDFHGHSCFDYTAEDHEPATNPITGNPAAHFQDIGTSQTQVRNAIGQCDPHAMGHAMHRLQDYYTHWAKGFRWNPPRQRGHLFARPNPDNDNAAWERAEAETRRWVEQWNETCHCIPCF